jgi:hypothetical protein
VFQNSNAARPPGDRLLPSITDQSGCRCVGRGVRSSRAEPLVAEWNTAPAEQRRTMSRTSVSCVDILLARPGQAKHVEHNCSTLSV